MTGAGASSFELNVTDPDFKFPQVWRTNLAVDQRLPWGITGTVEFLYNKDVNGIYYINANLPAPQTAFTGVDTRPRWTANRINNTLPNVITNAFVLKNQDVGKSWNISTSLAKSLTHGFSIRGAYSYGEARNTIDPGSTAGSTVRQQPALGRSQQPGAGVLGLRAGAPVLRAEQLHQGVLRPRGDHVLAVLGVEAVRSRTSPATAATCTAATSTATAPAGTT